MGDAVVVDRRYNGPPASGQGGYVAGTLARSVAGPAEVTLLRPVPLDTPLTVEDGDDGTVALTDGREPLARARTVDPPPIALPAPPDPDAAAAAGRGSPFRDPARHGFPTCFGCGYARTPADGGLRVIAGPAGDLVADLWTPGPSTGDGTVAPEIVWAALDCPGGFAARLLRGTPPSPLGRMTAALAAPVPVGDPVVCTGWVIDQDGRKTRTGTALSAADGTLLAYAVGVWITPR